MVDIKYLAMLLKAAETILGYFDFNMTARSWRSQEMQEMVSRREIQSQKYRDNGALEKAAKAV